MSQVTPRFCRSLVRVAENCTCDWLVELELVGTVAVPGVSVTEIPESRNMFAAPLFLGSATDVAVIMMVSAQFCEVEVQLLPVSLVGSGTWFGAVKVTEVFEELSGILPVVAVMQAFLVEVVDLPAESTLVVVY